MRSVRGWTRGVWLAIALVVAAGAAVRADGLPERTEAPDVVVRPTIAGVRAGKDEVLDRALAYLATGK